MRQTLTHICKGYLLVQMQGYSPERFLNLCKSNRIEIWELSCGEGGHRFKASLPDYRRVRPLVRKSGVRLKILGKFGLPFFLHRNRKRKLYAVGIAAFFLVLFIMTRFIWDITLEGNYRFTDDMLLHYLDTQDIRYGIRKSTVDCSQLEESIRSTYPEILWVSARVSGTRLMIRIKENDVVGQIPEREDSPRDLVSTKAGVITKMIVRRGKAQVSIGDTVEEGQVLVSGIVPICGDAGELIREQYVHADADVFARTQVVVKESLPEMVQERSETGRVRHGLHLRIGSGSFVWMLPKQGDLLWKITMDSRQLTVFGDFYLPVWLDRMEAREYQLYERCPTKEELNQKKEQFQAEMVQNFMEKGVAIIENNVKILDMDGGYELEGSFVLEEPVTAGREIIMTEEYGQPDEHSGDNH